MLALLLAGAPAAFHQTPFRARGVHVAPRRACSIRASSANVTKFDSGIMLTPTISDDAISTDSQVSREDPSVAPRVTTTTPMPGQIAPTPVNPVVAGEPEVVMGQPEVSDVGATYTTSQVTRGPPRPATPVPMSLGEPGGKSLNPSVVLGQPEISDEGATSSDSQVTRGTVAPRVTTTTPMPGQGPPTPVNPVVKGVPDVLLGQPEITDEGATYSDSQVKRQAQTPPRITTTTKMPGQRNI